MNILDAIRPSINKTFKKTQLIEKLLKKFLILQDLPQVAILILECICFEI